MVYTVCQKCLPLMILEKSLCYLLLLYMHTRAIIKKAQVSLAGQAGVSS